MALMIEGTQFDNLIHIFTAIVSLVLLVVAIRVYFLRKSQKFLLICIAFLLYAIKEILVVADVLYLSSPFLVALTHFLNLLVILIIFWGVVK